MRPFQATTHIAFYAASVIVIGLTVYGWVANIVKLWQSDTALSGAFALRLLGVIFPPLGAVLGFV